MPPSSLTPPPPSPGPPYRAILWDNDGVLVDTERWYFKATREVLAEVGIELTEALYFEHFLANSGGAWHLAAARGLSASAITSLRHDRNERYQFFLEHQPIAIPGVRETLQALRPQFTMGCPLNQRKGVIFCMESFVILTVGWRFSLGFGAIVRSKFLDGPARIGKRG
jgi:hypothetical protein